MYRNCVKRILAVLLSLLGIVCLGWLLVILSVAIKLDSPGPVLFRQKRVGQGKSHFYILKFRTMRIDTPKDMPTHLLENPELTPLFAPLTEGLTKAVPEEGDVLVNAKKSDLED